MLCRWDASSSLSRWGEIDDGVFVFDARAYVGGVNPLAGLSIVHICIIQTCICNHLLDPLRQ